MMLDVGKHPIENVQWVKTDRLNPCNWNPNRVAKPEMRLLEHSILASGWSQPILASRAGTIIDGFHRWRLAQDSPKVAALTGGHVPVAFLDVDEPTAMLMTVRMNRAKGAHVAVSMADLVKRCVQEHGLSVEQVMEGIGATRQEVELLLQESVFTERNISSWAYSRSWYPVRVSDAERAAMLERGEAILDPDFEREEAA